MRLSVEAKARIAECGLRVRRRGRSARSGCLAARRVASGASSATAGRRAARAVAVTVVARWARGDLAGAGCWWVAAFDRAAVGSRTIDDLAGGEP